MKTEDKKTEHCMVCAEMLEYLDRAEELRCVYCGRVEQGHIRCPKGHYICDVCHNRDAMRLVEEIAFSTHSGNPFEIAELMMSLPGLPMLGCQHAYIAGGALMAAIKNYASEGIKNEDIKEIFKRTKSQAHGGYCGLTGVCGIAPAIGACFAVLTGSRCGRDKEQRTTMEAVTRVTRAITDLTGPSCCKAYVRTSLEAAVKYLKESAGSELPADGEIHCTYSNKHPHGCREIKCPYFTGGIYGEPDNEREGPVSCTCNCSGIIKAEGTQEEGMEYLLNKAIESGAEKAKVIDTDTIVVEEWVRWKCKYGCPFYAKDAFHPPCAPDAESTGRVIKEYSKGILMNGPRGKALTEAVVKLEGEAYREGYYKAFALTALSSGPPGAT